MGHDCPPIPGFLIVRGSKPLQALDKEHPVHLAAIKQRRQARAPGAPYKSFLWQSSYAERERKRKADERRAEEKRLRKEGLIRNKDGTYRRI